MKLRKGRTKSILEGSLDSALLAVVIYNKPRTMFRSEGYITLMVIAWMKLLHAYFNRTIGDRYYYRLKSGRYDRVDGERKAWEWSTSVKEYNKLNPSKQLSEAVTANLQFFIGLRNKIEHRHVAKREVDTLIFGECQSLLYNYENVLVELFGEEHAINENLVYSLQFSQMRTQEQETASKKIRSKEVQEIRADIDNYRSSLPSEVFDSQEYSVKLIQIPKISNTNRNDVAVEFVRWSELSEEDKATYDQLVAIIKEKVVKKEAANAGKLKPGDVLEQVEARCGVKINFTVHKCLYYVFSIRPISEKDRDPFDTDTTYCHYDEAHGDYIYQESWVDFIVNTLGSDKVTLEHIKECYKNRQRLTHDTLEVLTS
jgi:hypothetical protein